MSPTSSGNNALASFFCTSTKASKSSIKSTLPTFASASNGIAYIECGTIFWRVSEAPAAPENFDPVSGLLLNDLFGMELLVGQIVLTVAYAGSESGDVRAVITFANGRCLEFDHSCETDSTLARFVAC